MTGPHADLLRVADDEIEFRVFFHHRDDVAAHFAGEHGEFDVLVVLEAVADDGRVVIGDGHDGQQFGFGAGFESEAVRPPEMEYLFDHLPLLIHLDRVDATVTALVIVFGDGALEGVSEFAEAMLEDIGEADQDRQVDAAQFEFFDQFPKIDRAGRILSGMHQDMAVVADREVALSPRGDIVQFGCIGRGPSLCRFPDRRRIGKF